MKFHRKEAFRSHKYRKSPSSNANRNREAKEEGGCLCTSKNLQKKITSPHRMKRKLVDIKDETHVSNNEKPRGSPKTTAFPLPILAPADNPTTYKPIAPAIARTSPATNVNANGVHPPSLAPATKLRKIEIAPSPVKQPPSQSPSKPKPKAIAKQNPIPTKRPLQALKPKIEPSTSIPVLSPRLGTSIPMPTTSPAPNTLWPSSPEALAQLELIASCLTPIATTSTAPQVPLGSMPALNPFALNAMQQLSATTPLPTAGLSPQFLASLGVPALGNNFAGMGLSNFPLLHPLDLNYINNVSKFSLPSKLMLNADLAQTHNLLLQNPHLLMPQVPSIDLPKPPVPAASFPQQPTLPAPNIAGSVTTTTTINSSNGSHNTHSNNSHKIKPSLIPALKLSVGKWERKSTFLGEVCAKFYYSKKKIVWEIMTLGLMAKMEIEFADIVGIEFLMPAEGTSTLTVQVKKPPRYFGEINPRPGKNIQWTESTDFTGGFGSTNTRHTLTFPKGSLQKHYEKLLSCDNRIKELAKAGLSAMRSQPTTFNTGTPLPPAPGSSSPLVSVSGSSLAPIVPATSRGMDALFKAALYVPPTATVTPTPTTTQQAGMALNLNLLTGMAGVGGLGLIPSTSTTPTTTLAPSPLANHPNNKPLVMTHSSPHSSPSASPSRRHNITSITATTPTNIRFVPLKVEALSSRADTIHPSLINSADIQTPCKEEPCGERGAGDNGGTPTCTESLASDLDDAISLSSLADASIDSLTQLAAAVANSDSSSSGNGLMKLTAEAS